LRDNWRNHIVLYVAFYSLSTVMFLVAEYTSSTVASTPWLTFVIAVVLGSVGILYAA
jgi:ABC-type transport system involved in multi-copper enzyme maturation permease subunit